MIQDYIETYIGEDSKRGEPLDALPGPKGCQILRANENAQRLPHKAERPEAICQGRRTQHLDPCVMFAIKACFRTRAAGL